MVVPLTYRCRTAGDGRASQTDASLKMRDGTRADCANLSRAASYFGASWTVLKRKAKASNNSSAWLSARAGLGPADSSVSLHEPSPAIRAVQPNPRQSRDELGVREWGKRWSLLELETSRLAADPSESDRSRG